jgi:glutamate synthase (NADPH/NADH) large chain
VVQAGGSDTAALDNVFELLVRAGRDAPMAKALMIPASIGQRRDDAEGASRHVPLLQRRDGAVGRPGRDRRDRRALGDRRARPQRPAPAALHASPRRAADRRLRNRHGEARRGDIIEKGRVGPGQTIGVDLETAKFYRDDALKDLLAARQPFGEWTKNIT